MPNTIALSTRNSSGLDATGTIACWSARSGLKAIADLAFVQPGQSVDIASLANDIGTGLTITNAVVNGSPVGSVTFTDTLVSFDTLADFDALLPGQFVVVTLTYSIQDANGETANGTILVRVERPAILWVDEDDAVVQDEDGRAVEG